MLIYCCNHYQNARHFDLPAKNRIWRKFVFIDECFTCHKPIAEIRELKKDGTTICQHRWKGNKAIEKFNKYLNESINLKNQLKTGSKNRMNWLYINGSNNVYNFNNEKVFKFNSFVNEYKLI